MRPGTFLMAVLALAAGAHAEDFGYTSRERPIPIRVERAEPVTYNVRIEEANLQLAIDPTRVTGSFDGDSRWSEQKFGLGYRQPLTDAWEVGHDTAAGFRRKDPFAGEAGDPALEEIFTLSQQGYLRWKGVGGLVLTGRAGSANSQSNDRIGFDESVNQSLQVAWKLSAATTVNGDAGFQQRYGMDSSIVNQDIYTLALEHRLQPVPVTLQTSQSFVREDCETAPDESKDLLRFKASARWEIEPRAAFTLGLESNKTDFAGAAGEEFGQVYFSELKLDPTEVLRVSMKAAYETRDALSADVSTLPAESRAVSFTLGIDMKFSPVFGAGMTFRYKLDDASARDASGSPAYLSLSGSAFF